MIFDILKLPRKFVKECRERHKYNCCALCTDIREKCGINPDDIVGRMTWMRSNQIPSCCWSVGIMINIIWQLSATDEKEKQVIYSYMARLHRALPVNQDLKKGLETIRFVFINCEKLHKNEIWPEREILKKYNLNDAAMHISFYFQCAILAQHTWSSLLSPCKCCKEKPKTCVGGKTFAETMAKAATQNTATNARPTTATIDVENEKTQDVASVSANKFQKRYRKTKKPSKL